MQNQTIKQKDTLVELNKNLQNSKPNSVKHYTGLSCLEKMLSNKECIQQKCLDFHLYSLDETNDQEDFFHFSNLSYCPGTFEKCKSLVSINIPMSVSEIQKRTFTNCSSLQALIIPNSVTCIQVKAFSDCTSLKSVTIPNSVTIF